MSASRTGGALRIGEVARRAGVSVEAVRHYEREGLLPKPARTLRGARHFPPDVLARIAFLKQAQAAGLMLRDIRQLVGLDRGRNRSACERMRRVLAERLREVDARMQEMQVFRTALEAHLGACEDALVRRADPACPSLEALIGGGHAGNNGADQ
jgi:DNA-binding transcriptional MerR regulator